MLWLILHMHECKSISWLFRTGSKSLKTKPPYHPANVSSVCFSVFTPNLQQKLCSWPLCSWSNQQRDLFGLQWTIKWVSVYFVTDWVYGRGKGLNSFHRSSSYWDACYWWIMITKRKEKNAFNCQLWLPNCFWGSMADPDLWPLWRNPTEYLWAM